jgi:hopanoid C-3 methylase
VEGIKVARDYGYGVTGNFVIDPEWDETDFKRLWAFVDEHRLQRAGYTILTPLPGTPYYESVREKIRAVDWSQFDMSHLLWEPRLGASRFFELYCETWRRSVLYLGGTKPWWRWVTEVKPKHIPFLMRMLYRTQRMMDPDYYLAEHQLTDK